ncbi:MULTISPECIES: DUF4309 domain-containing protein [Bhargavaea]|uniref:DUF4309 domain-containing protein n=1 Tax=Bhargavaea changchunensis TaxID=2134037 RepID=A0ABW2NDG7_9BACL|nr:DUF4309 domain-containing protein [Bhargavaea sp. CC-171006]
MKQKQLRKLAISAATAGMLVGLATPSSASGHSERLMSDHLAVANGTVMMLGQKDGMFNDAYNMLAITLGGQLAASPASEQASNEEKSVMPASFYSELEQGKVPGASVQIGSALSDLKAKEGKPEDEYDFEGGIRHVYGNYHYGVPYVEDEKEEKPVTTVTYHFKEKPTVDEVRHFMGSAEESAGAEGMEFDYLWYSKGDYEVFFEFPAGADKVDNVTVKWNYS